MIQSLLGIFWCRESLKFSSQKSLPTRGEDELEVGQCALVGVERSLECESLKLGPFPLFLVLLYLFILPLSQLDL